MKELGWMWMTYLGESRLRERQLNEVYRGGLGSYAVSLTVIGFFNVLLHGPFEEFG